MNRYLSTTMVALTMALCLSPDQAEARFASIKAAGMGDVGVAYPQDSLAQAYNPAGITDVPNTMDLNAALVHVKQTAWVRDNNGIQNILHNFPVPSVAASQPIPVNGKFSASTRHKNVPAVSGGIVYHLPHDMVVGFAVWANDFVKVTGKPNALVGNSLITHTPPTPPTVILAKKFGIEFENVQGGPTFAVKLFGCSFGVQALFAVQREKYNGLAAFANATFSAHPGHVTDHGYSYSWGATYALGWKTDLRDWLSLGLSFHPKIHMTRFKKYEGINPQRAKLDNPLQVAGGVTIRPYKGITVSADVTYQDVHDVHFLGNPVLTQTGLINDKLGSNEGSGYGWKRRVYYNLGADWKINDQFQVRAGYEHINRVVRRSQTFLNVGTLPAVITNYFSCGATWYAQWKPLKGLRASVFYTHGFKRKVRGKHSIPSVTGFVPSATSPPFFIKIGDQFGGGNVDLAARLDAGGIGFGYDY